MPQSYLGVSDRGQAALASLGDCRRACSRLGDAPGARPFGARRSRVGTSAWRRDKVTPGVLQYWTRADQGGAEAA
jgi:hypothetical protein